MLISSLSSASRSPMKSPPPVDVPCRCTSTQFYDWARCLPFTRALVCSVLLAAGLACSAIQLQAAEAKPNVIIITIDTVRADHLGWLS